ncbi:8408c782-ebf3-4e38-821f-690b9a13f85e [Sclerotinia trifoliorum]|uniref:8408c782-ebf3-4e38-821f-690b9a13f85e n=1 Tax=Sclerotinia trifoliorum TaxID=28548 RepID=A0A8H2W1E6_9HELO|nr:8408c782-ebf3-4e38-821f-690b9a13f85e [Sclerotinia trifoliorum]
MEQASPSLPQLFGIIPTGQPPIINPTSAPSPTSFVFTLPARPYNHICVFLLPGITLPPSTAAAVYISLPPSSNASTSASTPPFKFLGGIGPGKESAIFKINRDTTPQNSNSNPAPEIDMDADSVPSSTDPQGGITLGISLESADSVSAQMAQLSSSSPSPSINASNPSTSLILSRPSQIPKTDTLLLAQRIIKNAFNFLASFSGNVMDGGNGKGVEVVPLKAFEEWWRKFEVRVRNDPGFLERDGD